MIIVMTGDANPARRHGSRGHSNTCSTPKVRPRFYWYVPSPDGTLLGGIDVRNGSEDGSVHVFEVATGQQLYEVLPRVQYPTGGGSLAWRADGKGFWYTRYPGTEQLLEADRHFHMAVYFHELGKDPARDVYVFGHDLPKLPDRSE